MTIDAWDPKTFTPDIAAVLTAHSKLILDFYVEDRKLMDEHLNSSTYRSLEPNRFFPDFQKLRENTLAPIIAMSRIRAWHYSRLTDDEVVAMYQELVPSSLEHLRLRLDKLVAKNLLTLEESNTVFAQSPFHEQPVRTGCLCATIIPISSNDCGVKLLLGSWGGESAYFWLSDQKLAITLKSLGSPRIIELETGLSDSLNGYKVAETFLLAWARNLGAPVSVIGCDLFIKEEISTAKVLRIHTKGDVSFKTIGTTYPNGVAALLNKA